MQKIISFPHMGNYEVPIENLLINVFRGIRLSVAENNEEDA